MQTRPRRVSARFNRVVGSLALLFTVSVVPLPSHAIPLAFDFSFSDSDGSREVNGQIFGLSSDGPELQQASLVTITSVDGEIFDVEFPLDFVEEINNGFVVSEGIITDSFFAAGTVLPLDPSEGAESLSITLLLNQFTDQFGNSAQNPIFQAQLIVNTLEPFSLVDRFGSAPLGMTPFSPGVPISEPSPIALLGAGVIAFGVLRRKKRQTAK